MGISGIIRSSMTRTGKEEGSTISKWVVFALCAAAYFFVYFHRVSSAVIATDIKGEFGISASALGLLSSMYFYPYAALQIPVGMVADRKGPAVAIVGGMLLAAIGSALFGLSRSFSMALVGRAISGAGVAAIYIPSLKLLLDAFGMKRFSVATGLMFSVGNLGSFFASTPLAILVASIGWRASFFTISALSVAICVLCWLYLPRGSNRGEGGARGAGSEATKGNAAISKGIWVIGAAMLLKYGPLMGYQGLWGIPYLSDVFGMSKVEASNIIMAVSLGYIVGSPLVGRINDLTRAYSKNVFLAINTFFMISWIPFAFMTGTASPVVLYLFSFALGVSSGGSGVIGFSLAKGFSDEGREATSMGVVNALTLLGGAIFQSLMGAVIDRTEAAGLGAVHAYSSSFKLAFASSLMVVVASLLLRFSKSRINTGKKPA